MIHSSFTRLGRLGAAGLLMLLAGACGTLRPASTAQPAYYSLDSMGPEAGTAMQAPGTMPASALTLIVNPPHATSGYDSQRIIYVRTEHKLEYFAHSEWVDTPARMLAPLVVSAVERGGAFRAVVLTPSAVAGDLRLDTEIVRLQQDFGSQPSRVRFTLRAYLVDNSTRKVAGWREFDETVAAASEDPYGGVVAANRAVQAVLKQLASYCAESAGNWQRSGQVSGQNTGQRPVRNPG